MRAGVGLHRVRVDSRNDGQDGCHRKSIRESRPPPMTQLDAIIGIASIYLCFCFVAHRNIEGTLLENRLCHHLVPAGLLITASAVAVGYVVSSLLLLLV